MKFVERSLESFRNFIYRLPGGRKLSPLVNAIEDFFLGTDKTAQESPYIHDAIDIKRYMFLVVAALIIPFLGGVYFYGWRVLAMVIVSYIAGGLTEIIFAIARRKSIEEGFLVTGLIFPLTLPPTLPLWMVGVGSIFGVFFGKEVFGGTGRNIFNPALVGRVFLSVAFPEYFATHWMNPIPGGGFTYYTADTITSATPLINFKTAHTLTPLSSLLLGTVPGSAGETFRIGIILGGLALILMRVVDWRIPLSYLATVGFAAFLGNTFSPEKFAPPLFQLLGGGLLLGAFFMATDPVSSPLSFEGKWIYGILLGIFTVLIRALSGFPEGVMFAILLGNAFAPLIDTWVVNRKTRVWRIR